jgi:hypothetical protein
MGVPQYIQQLREVGQHFKDPKKQGEVFLLRGTEDGNIFFYRAEVIEEHDGKKYDPPRLSEMTHTSGENGNVEVELDPVTHQINVVTSRSRDGTRQYIIMSVDSIIRAEAYDGMQWDDLTSVGARRLYNRGLESARKAVQVVGLQRLLGEGIKVVLQEYPEDSEVAKKFEI